MLDKRLVGVLCVVSLPGLMPAQAAPKRPAIDGIGHMTVFAADPAASKKFYVGELGFVEGTPDSKGEARFYADAKQYVAVAPLPAEHTNSRLKAIYYRTADAEGLRRYLAAHAVIVPAKVERDTDGTASFEVSDPEGNTVGFEQVGAQRHIAAGDPTSRRMIHVGFAVHDRAAEDRFYQGILGFRPYWHGAMKDGVSDDWVSMQVPDGSDWLEYMVDARANPTQRTLGVLNHFSLGITDINLAASRLEAHGWHESPGEHRQDGRDGKRQLNVFDPDLTRVEFMEFQPFKEPCCSAFTAAHPQP